MEAPSAEWVGEDVSRFVSEHLDQFGYSERRRATRIAHWDKWSEAKTLSTRTILQNERIDKVFVGSCSEGISLMCESDMDILQVNNAVVCQAEVKTDEASDKIVFQLDRDSAPPGYTFLKLRNGHDQPYARDLATALVDRNGEVYLSSEEYMKINEDVFYKSKGCTGRNTIYMERKGPSIPKYVKDGQLVKIIKALYSLNLNEDIDLVRGFPCFCPDLLQSWYSLERYGDWPSEQIKNHVTNTNIYVVPVGEKMSDNEDLQWRLSFIDAEICLVRSMNDTQAKVLILLRQIARHFLTPVCPDITSYVIKNVMFWLAESHLTETFQEYYLLDRLEDGMKLLKSCVEKRALACYMHPDRNILKGKISEKEKQAVIQRINTVLENYKTFIQQLIECHDRKQDQPKFVEILEDMEMLNVVDALSNLIMSYLTVQKLEEYNTAMALATSSLKSKLYHFYYCVWPYLSRCICKGTICLDIFEEIAKIELPTEKQMPAMSVTPQIPRSQTKTSETSSDSDSKPEQPVHPEWPSKIPDQRPSPLKNAETIEPHSTTPKRNKQKRKKNKKHPKRQQRLTWQPRNTEKHKHNVRPHLQVTFAPEKAKNAITLDFIVNLLSILLCMYSYKNGKLHIVNLTVNHVFITLVQPLVSYCNLLCANIINCFLVTSSILFCIYRYIHGDLEFVQLTSSYAFLTLLNRLTIFLERDIKGQEEYRKVDVYQCMVNIHEYHHQRQASLRRRRRSGRNGLAHLSQFPPF